MRPPVRPRWIVFSVLVVFVTVACVVLGFWQLRRLDDRRASNVVLGSRLARAPVALAEIRRLFQPQEGVEAWSLGLRVHAGHRRGRADR